MSLRIRYVHAYAYCSMYEHYTASCPDILYYVDAQLRIRV